MNQELWLIIYDLGSVQWSEAPATHVPARYLCSETDQSAQRGLGIDIIHEYLAYLVKAR